MGKSDMAKEICDSGEMSEKRPQKHIEERLDVSALAGKEGPHVRIRSRCSGAVNIAGGS
jgi:hypothetical protein